ncbi:MAG: T9SS type A sorting domain-containing protein, partial [bacterium]|nr:T9SS type A sorting domain-containing protein [bacterium]
MFKHTFLTTLVIVVTVVSANAGVIYLELPEEITVEMVRYPTIEDTELIRDFVIEEVNNIDGEEADRVVILTKNDEPVFKETEPLAGSVNEEDAVATMGDRYTYGEIKITPEGGGWSPAEESSIITLLEGIYPQCKAVFGMPVVRTGVGWREVYVVRKEDAINEWGMYNISSDEIYFNSWPMGDPSVARDTGRAHLTRNVLHAFRWETLAAYDHFGGGMVHAAWLQAQKILAGLGVMTMFNDTNHDSLLPDDQTYRRPYYASYEQYNVPELATGLPDFFSKDTDVNLEIRKARYNACGYAWWKVNRASNGFIKNYNLLLTKFWNGCWYWGDGPRGFDWYVSERPQYDDLKDLAVEAFNNPHAPDAIEGMEFETWFDRQPIINRVISSGNQLFLAADRDKARIFSYFRDGPYEWSNDGSANIKKKNAYATEILEEFNIMLDDGFGEIDFALRYSGESFVFDTTVTLEGEVVKHRADVYGRVTGNRKKFYGVLPFQIPDDPFRWRPADLSLGDLVVWDDDGNTHTLKDFYQIGNQELTWFGFSSDLWDGFDPAESEVLHCRFEPTFPDLFSFAEDDGTPHYGSYPLEQEYTFRRDAGEYGLYKGFVPPDYLQDGNENGISDADELLLMEKFKPVVYMHNRNMQHPCKVEVSLHHGYLCFWKKEFDPIQLKWVWELEESILLSPNGPHSAEELFGDPEMRIRFEQYLDGTGADDLTLTFGGADPESMITEDYWWTIWGQIQGQSPPPPWETDLYTKPVTYAWMFQEGGKAIIQYWFYYPINDWGNNHESDWERINVRLTNADPDKAIVEDVCFYFHKLYKIKGHGDLTFHNETHPKIHVGGKCLLPFRATSTEYDMGAGTMGNIADGKRTKLDFDNSPDGYALPDTVSYPNVYGTFPGSYTNVNNYVYWHDQSSGGSYWRTGVFIDVGGFPLPLANADEHISETGGVTHDLELICLDFRDNQLPFSYQFWHVFPGYWGRPGRYLDMDFDIWGMVDGINTGGCRSPYRQKELKVWVDPKKRLYDRDKGNEFGGKPLSSKSTPTFPFALAQTYPNPAKNSSVNFNFSVPDPCRATISIFDITGRKVAVPYDNKIVPGAYSAEMNTSSLAAGIYIYRLEAGTDVAVKKM